MTTWSKVDAFVPPMDIQDSPGILAESGTLGMLAEMGEVGRVEKFGTWSMIDTPSPATWQKVTGG